MQQAPAISVGNAAALFGAPASPSPLTTPAPQAANGSSPSGYFAQQSVDQRQAAGASQPSQQIGFAPHGQSPAQSTESAADLFGADSNDADQAWFGDNAGASLPDQASCSQAGGTSMPGHSPQPMQNTWQGPTSPNPDQYAQYLSPQQPRGFTSAPGYPQASNMYYDANAPQQYQQNLQSQAHDGAYAAQASQFTQASPSGGFNGQYQDLRPSQTVQYASYQSSPQVYSQTPAAQQYAPQYQQPTSPKANGTHAYGMQQSSQGYLQQPQAPSIQPYSAPASSAFATYGQQQQKQPQQQSYAPHHANTSYTTPYAQAADPYAPQQSQNTWGSRGNVTANGSGTQYANQQQVPQQANPLSIHSPQLGSGPQQADAAAKTLNRSKSSFFAELPTVRQPKVRGGLNRMASAQVMSQHGNHFAPAPNVPPLPPAASRSYQSTTLPSRPQSAASQSYQAPLRPASSASTSSYGSRLVSSQFGSSVAQTNYTSPASPQSSHRDLYSPPPVARSSFDQQAPTNRMQSPAIGYEQHRASPSSQYNAYPSGPLPQQYPGQQTQSYYAPDSALTRSISPLAGQNRPAYTHSAAPPGRMASPPLSYGRPSQQQPVVSSQRRVTSPYMPSQALPSTSSIPLVPTLNIQPTPVEHRPSLDAAMQSLNPAIPAVAHSAPPQEPDAQRSQQYDHAAGLQESQPAAVPEARQPFVQAPYAAQLPLYPINATQQTPVQAQPAFSEPHMVSAPSQLPAPFSADPPAHVLAPQKASLSTKGHDFAPATSPTPHHAAPQQNTAVQAPPVYANQSPHLPQVPSRIVTPQIPVSQAAAPTVPAAPLSVTSKPTIEDLQPALHAQNDPISPAATARNASPATEFLSRDILPSNPAVDGPSHRADTLHASDVMLAPTSEPSHSHAQTVFPSPMEKMLPAEPASQLSIPQVAIIAPSPTVEKTLSSLGQAVDLASLDDAADVSPPTEEDAWGIDEVAPASAPPSPRGPSSVATHNALGSPASPSATAEPPIPAGEPEVEDKSQLTAEPVSQTAVETTAEEPIKMEDDIADDWGIDEPAGDAWGLDDDIPELPAPAVQAATSSADIGDATVPDLRSLPSAANIAASPAGLKTSSAPFVDDMPQVKIEEEEYDLHPSGQNNLIAAVEALRVKSEETDPAVQWQTQVTEHVPVQTHDAQQLSLAEQTGESASAKADCFTDEYLTSHEALETNQAQQFSNDAGHASPVPGASAPLSAQAISSRDQPAATQPLFGYPDASYAAGFAPEHASAEHVHSHEYAEPRQAGSNDDAPMLWEARYEYSQPTLDNAYYQPQLQSTEQLGIEAQRQPSSDPVSYAEAADHPQSAQYQYYGQPQWADIRQNDLDDASRSAPNQEVLVNGHADSQAGNLDAYGPPPSTDPSVQLNTHEPVLDNGATPVSQSTYDPYGPAKAIPPAMRALDPAYAMHARQPAQGFAEYAAAPLQATYPGVDYAVTTPKPFVSSPYAAEQADSRPTMQQNAHSDARPAVPIAKFGFNGVLLTHFPSTDSHFASESYASPYGSGAMASSRACIKVQKVSELLPSETSLLEAFPGPLYLDPSTSTASAKQKKRRDVQAWLDSRIEQLELGSTYYNQSSDQYARESQDRTLLLRLIKLQLDNNGKLVDSSSALQAVIDALLAEAAQASHGNTQTYGFGSSMSTEPAQTLQSMLPKDLTTLQHLLLRGSKSEAVRFALDRHMFAHAILISRGLDIETQTEVIKEFCALALTTSSSESFEPLKVLYRSLSGSGTASLQELVAPRSLAEAAREASQLNLTVAHAGQAMSRASTPTSQLSLAGVSGSLAPTSLSKWRQVAAALLSNKPDGCATTLSGLGDMLTAAGATSAAHSCYLLSTGLLQAGNTPQLHQRPLLFGSQSSLHGSDVEAVMMTEIVEFAHSLAPVSKGQEAFHGLPYLQPYKLQHARELSAHGLRTQAQKYNDAIAAIMKAAPKNSLHPAFVTQAKAFSDRLAAVPYSEKTSSWISRKVQRPTLDNVWSTLEGRFAKFVAGDETEEPKSSKTTTSDPTRQTPGPFANYSSITPAGPDSISRAPSVSDLSQDTPAMPNFQSAPNSVYRPHESEGHGRKTSYGYSAYSSDPYGPYAPRTSDDEVRASQHNPSGQAETTDQQQQQHQNGYTTPQNDGGWWSAANAYTPSNASEGHAPNGPYGQQPIFSPVENGYANAEVNGLLSPMQMYSAATPSYTPSEPSKLSQSTTGAEEKQHSYADDDDDLGLGNNANKKKKQPDASASENAGEASGSKKEDRKEDAKKDDDKGKGQDKAAGASWFGRMFRREAGSPGPIRAKLGEETSFVYDPVEKRWVNKKSGADTPPPAAIPPPPRSQTASPSFAGGMPPPPMSTTSMSRTNSPAPPFATSTPPPAASSITSPGLPPPPSTRPTPPPSVPTRAASTDPSMPPPPRRPATTAGASRKNIRSRYVDVFAQQQQQEQK